MANTRVYIVPSSDGKQRAAYPSGNWVNVNAPSGLTATVSGGSIVFQVTENNGGTASIIVQRSASPDSGFYDFATGTAGVATILTTGNPAGTYYYRALASVNGVRSSASSNVVSASVSLTSGIVDGGTVTVTIPGAGANVPASNFSFLGGSYGSIQSGTVGGLFTTVAPAGWDMPGGTGTQISSDAALTGTKSLVHDRSRGFQFGFAYNTGGIRRVGFARWSVLFQNPNNIQGGQLKQVRMVGGTSNRLEDYSYANTYLSGWTGSGGVYAARNDSPSVGTNLSSGTGREWHRDNEWVTVHYRVTDSSAPGVADASIQVMTILESTGQVLGTWTQNNVLLRSSADALIRNIVFQFYMGNNFNGSSGCKTFIDRDIVAGYSDTATPPKYILLGNAPTFSACTKRTYCEYLQWTQSGADANIEIVINKGYHNSLDGLYFYAMSDAGQVINENGVSLNANSAQKLFETDFSQGYNGFNFFGADRRTIVTANPPPGKSHSVRFNLKNNVTDPITGKLFTSSSNFYTGQFVHGINTKNYQSITFVMPFRLDDFLWPTFDANPLAVDGKLVYISHRGASSEQGFYLSGGAPNGMAGSTGRLNWGDNWMSGSPWEGWQNTAYGWRSSGGGVAFVANGSTGAPWGTDGIWHKLKIQFVFNYTDASGTYTRARALIDDIPASGSSANYSADGWTRLPPEFTPDIIRTFYANTSGASSVNGSVDRTGAAAGLQVGDLEIWSGLV